MTQQIKQYLDGGGVALHPFSNSVINKIVDCADDVSIFKFNMTPGQPLKTYMASYIDLLKSHQENEKHNIYVVHHQNRVCGITQFYNISPENKSLAIGYTWYHPSLWGTVVNPETKLLLLTHVFEELNYNRVEFHVDSDNHRFVGAMTKLGAVKEGVLRKHRIVRGGFARDTVLFSIIKDDWFGVKDRLALRLGEFS